MLQQALVEGLAVCTGFHYLLFSHAVFTESVLVTPDAQEHLAKEVTQQAATGTWVAATVTTISYPRELVW